MNLKQLFFTGNASAKLCLLLSGALLSLSVTAFAQEAPVTPCDPQYMDALESRAWLEAQREIAQNKNFIFKPDSVLEYTCFVGFLDEAASNFDPNRQFSETDRWDGRPEGFEEDSTDIALTEVVLSALVVYLENNFNGEMGRYLNNRPGDPDPEYEVPDGVDGARPYDCNQMQQVWLKARCMNFNETPENAYDGFFDFAYYEGTDPRTESRAWGGMCETADPRFATARTSAFNEDQALFDVTTEITEAEGDGEPYEEDDIVTHLDKILPGNCDAAAIPTGVMVERPDIRGGSPYAEAVCPQPGCANPPGGTECTEELAPPNQQP